MNPDYPSTEPEVRDVRAAAPIRTGLTKVGLPGAELGLGPLDPSVADVMKSLGHATGQFGKNHLGDRNEHLPTVHGFDEFFGNLYHLNAEEEPENPDYPRDPRFRAKFGPRGVLKTKATDKDDPTIDPPSGVSASRRSKILARLTPSGWKQSTRNFSLGPRISSIVNRRPEHRGSVISTRRACTSSHI